MKLIVCIDTKKGMMFFGRRQSQDGALRKWIIEHTKGQRLWMSSYSSKQFGDIPDCIVDDDYVSKAGEDDYCFVGPYQYGIDSQQTISMEYGEGKAYDFYTAYFKERWDDSSFCKDAFLPRENEKQP